MLPEGTEKIGEKIGRETQRFAMYTKRLELVMTDCKRSLRLGGRDCDC